MRSLATVLAGAATLLSLACGQPPGERTEPGPPQPNQATATPTALHRNPQKEVYFGDLHVHSSWSLDAFTFQVRVGPEDAYRYARGGSIPHVSGKEIQQGGPPLDFLALTEHANYMGISTAAQEPGSAIRERAIVKRLLDPDPDVHTEAIAAILDKISSDTFMPELSPEPVIEDTWRRLVELADRQNTPGEFTAFAAYEYTSMPGGQNLHRNVVFRGSRVPDRPFSSFDSQNPEDLWRWMDEARAAGSDVLAIPHNANGSNGLMYELTTRAGGPIDDEYATTRMRNEPISEVIQIKGQSETHPALSPDDEWAEFAILETILGRPRDKSKLQGSYARRALMDGLEMEEASGVNPYRFGMLASSDGHNASSPVEEDNFTGKIGVADGTPEVRIPMPASEERGIDLGDLSSGSPFSAAGLAGVWAESNTREDLFDAMRSREVFATSGPRIRVRFFAGPTLSDEDLQTGIAMAGYSRGVAMGGALDTAGRPPVFLIEALQDPREAPLERLQIVKAWVENGKARERIYDVACANGAAPEGPRKRCALESQPPDLTDCSYDAGRGRSSMAAAWTDPDFDPAQRGFYYARVLQIPTCRWSTYDAIRLGVPPPKGAPAWLQERAVTSPIWVAPESPVETG